MSEPHQLVFAPTALRRVEEWLSQRGQRDAAWIDQCMSGPATSWMAHGEMMQGLKRLQADFERQERERDRLLAGGLPRRGPRQMPSLRRIAEYHSLGERPWCLGCDWKVPLATWTDASGLLERAHIIDRVFDGLDTLANLAPLCSRCHKTQPIFRPGDEEAALQWFGLPVDMAETHG